MTNSAHFVSTISSETILDNKIMLSFDVEWLFTNVRIDVAIQAALQKLENDPSLAETENDNKLAFLDTAFPSESDGRLTTSVYRSLHTLINT